MSDQKILASEINDLRQTFHNMLMTSGNILSSAAQNKDRLEQDNSKPFDEELIKLGHEWEYFDSVCDQLYSILDNLKSTVEMEEDLQPLEKASSSENTPLEELPVEVSAPEAEILF